MNKNRACVIGYGSIGRRHAEVLAQLEVDVAVVSRRSAIDFNGRIYSDLGSAIKEFTPQYLVIATETANHHKILSQINCFPEFRGSILVEKPLFSVPQNLDLRKQLKISVGYNLRFHSGIIALKKALQSDLLNSVSLSVGQWLPSWRPSTDYKSSYSAKKEAGGGVLRDLSHEIDLALSIGGEWQAATATIGKRSNLDIETEDVADILLQCTKCKQINIHLDYLNKLPRRVLQVNGTHHSYLLDLISGNFYIDDKLDSVHNLDRNHSYIAMHKNLIASGDQLCSFSEGLKITKLIERIEIAGNTLTWVKNE